MRKGSILVYAVMGVIATFGAWATVSDTETVTSQAYVQDKLDDLEPIMTPRLVDTAVSFPREDAPVVTHEIRDTLGSSTSDTGLPQVDAVNAGMTGKQAKLLNLGSENVVTYTATAGEAASTPIYSATNQFSNGLVRAATVNTAIAAAVNNELVEVSNPSGTLWRVNTTVTNPITTTEYLPTHIAGTSYCRKNQTPNATYDGQGSCAAALYNEMQTGDWATVFSWGTVRGISVCSDDDPNPNTFGGVQIAAKQTAISADYATWVENRPTTPISNNHRHCYCKRGDASTAGSSWAFNLSYSSASLCANACANYCGAIVRRDVDFRSAVFAATSQ